MLVAHHLACQCLPRYSSKFSRHDFTLRQLFACLVLREHQRQSYRGCEALLRDAEHWCHAIGMRKAPDHNTLCRAFGVVVTGRLMGKALDVLARWFSLAKVLRLSAKPLSMDTTYFESRHVSRHYERRRAETKAGTQSSKSEAKAEAREMADAGGSRTRRRSTKKLPKAGFAVACACHAILAARVSTGAGADQRWLEPLLYPAWRRVPNRRFTAVADCGFDSEENHRTARRDMGLRTVIPPGAGRKPKDKKAPPGGRWRRHMKRLLRTKRSRRRCGYTQRWQSETVNSMVKRNLGSALRARTPQRRECEMLLRAVVHDIMLLRRRRGEGRDRAGHSHFPGKCECPLCLIPPLLFNPFRHILGASG